MKQDGRPLVLIFLIGIVCLALRQSTPEEPWTPPYLGRDLGWSKVDSSGDRLTLDPRGLGDLSELSFLPFPLPELKPGQVLEVASAGSVPIKREPDGNSTVGYPRAVISQSFGEQQIKAVLYQPATGQNLFAGPIAGRITTPLYRPREGGVSLEALSLLPPETTRAVLIDSEGLRLPEQLRTNLIEQWKRWEFEPYVTLKDAFDSPLVYAQWREKSILLTAIEDWEAVEEAIGKRFPPNVVALLSTWSHATTISGFEKKSGPAWMARGNFLIATPDGGVEYLQELLTHRYSRPPSFDAGSPLLKQLQGLAESEKGWHLCIIEQPPRGRLHWGALLRWPRSDEASIEGFLVVWIAPKPRKERDS